MITNFFFPEGLPVIMNGIEELFEPSEFDAVQDNMVVSFARYRNVDVIICGLLLSFSMVK